MTTEDRIRFEYDRLRDLAIAKNRAYGDSALNPIRIFSDLPATAGLRVRLDDKLSRLKGDPKAFEENPLDDLIGYSMLLRIAERVEAEGQS